ncbi:MAG: cytochrome c [Bdellovibrionaceae bacterium]|nr:cytochrome c [Pseudobdellovibrionaceae bacterium]
MSESSDVHNRGGFAAFLFSMVFVFAFFAYIALIHPGVELGENVVDPNAPASQGGGPVFKMADVKEPWISTPEIVAYGAKAYKSNCATCHGDSGKGDGPAGGGLNPKPRNLVEGKWTQGTGTMAHFKVVAEGIPNSSMASFKHIKLNDRWAILHYIDSITENKSKDDPAKVAEFAKTAQ